MSPFTMPGVLTLALFSALATPRAIAQSAYCAFEIVVRTPSGAPFAHVPVALVRTAAKTEFSEAVTDSNGVAKLCDAPLETVSVVVGFDICGSVLIRNLKPRWPEGQRVFVTYTNDFSCDHFGVSRNCQVLLRVKDDYGRALAGAHLIPKLSSGSGTDVSDFLGRLFRSVARNEKIEGTIEKDGYESVRISIPSINDDKELTVVMRRASKMKSKSAP